MLFLWLFGVGIGIANACLVVPGMVMSAPSHAADDRSALAEPDSSPAQPNCMDCCAKGSVSTPLLKSALDGLQGHAAVPPALATVLPGPAFAPLQLWVPRRDGVPAPTIPIAFLRLAL